MEFSRFLASSLLSLLVILILLHSYPDIRSENAGFGIPRCLCKDLLNDLQEVFAILRSINMKLNPEKCTFALGAGKFLGYLISRRGIDANPSKLSAITEMASPVTTRQLQILTGHMASLSRFLSRSADKALPFFQLLKGPKKKLIEWVRTSLSRS